MELGEGEGKDDGHAMAPQNQSCHGVKSTMIGRHADQMTLYSCVIGCSRFTAMENENTRAERVSDAVSGAKRDNSQHKKKKKNRVAPISAPSTCFLLSRQTIIYDPDCDPTIFI